MILLMTTALAAECNTPADRADTSCWLDDWHTEGRATMDIGIKRGKKWVSFQLDGETVSEGQLEGARAKRTAAMDGCGASLVVQDDGRILVSLDGPECPIEAAGSYSRGKKGAAAARPPSLCTTQTLFSCSATDGTVLSVCEADGNRTLLNGKLGGKLDSVVEGGSELIRSAANDRWEFKANGGMLYTVTISNVESQPGARLTVEMGSGTLGTTDCSPGWFRK